MKIKEATARELLKAVGYANADKYAPVTVRSRLEGLASAPEAAKRVPSDPSLARLLHTLLASLKLEPVEVVPGPPVRGGPKTLTNNAIDEEAVLAPRKRRNKRGARYWLLQCLKAASAADPVTHEEIRAFILTKTTNKIERTNRFVASFPGWVPIRYPEWTVVQVKKGGKAAFYAVKGEV